MVVHNDTQSSHYELQRNVLRCIKHTATDKVYKHRQSALIAEPVGGARVILYYYDVSHAAVSAHTHLLH
jgi:hypothetical protein